MSARMWFKFCFLCQRSFLYEHGLGVMAVVMLL